jgi:hypothetical protein
VREPPELKHLSRVRKRNQKDCLSSGERKGKSLNSTVFSETCGGLWDPDMGVDKVAEWCGIASQRK